MSSLMFLAMASNGGMDSERVANLTFPEQHFILHLKVCLILQFIIDLDLNYLQL